MKAQNAEQRKTFEIEKRKLNEVIRKTEEKNKKLIYDFQYENNINKNLKKEELDRHKKELDEEIKKVHQQHKEEMTRNVESVLLKKKSLNNNEKSPAQLKTVSF